MKTVLRKSLVLGLILLTVLATALTASASVSVGHAYWTETSMSFTATVRPLWESGEVALFNNTAISHTGTSDTIIRSHRNESIMASISFSPQPIREEKLCDAVEDAGLVTSGVFSISDNTSCVIPASEPYGIYVIAAYYYTYDGEWDVYTSGSRVEDGTFDGAVQLTEYFLDYYKV